MAATSRFVFEETLWLAQGRQAAAGEFSFRDWGWLLRGDRWTAFDPRMEVGQRYIAPLARVNGEWVTMALLAIPVEDGRDLGMSEDEVRKLWMDRWRGLYGF